METSEILCQDPWTGASITARGRATADPVGRIIFLSPVKSRLVGVVKKQERSMTRSTKSTTQLQGREALTTAWCISSLYADHAPASQTSPKFANQEVGT